MSLVSMLGVSIAFAACGSSDGKRRAAAAEAGAAGNAGAASSEGGASGGGGGVPASGGKGGTSPAGPAGEGSLGGGAAGADGGGESGGQGGAAGGGYSDQPVPGDTFASPTGSDMANDCLVETTPCKTITYAAAQAAPSHTVWLAGGRFTNVDQPMAATVVTGVRVRARELGNAILQVRLTLLGSHRVEGLVFDGGASNTGNPGIDVTTGTVALEGVAFSGRLATALKISGNAAVTLSPGDVTDYVSGVLAYVDVS